jgi:hypothetical protein
LINRGGAENGFREADCGGQRQARCADTQCHCYKNQVALEVEWKDRDSFYDRDLNNFRLLFDLHAIVAGVIVTRCTELQMISDDLGPSYGSSTTYMAKLRPRLNGGSGGGCPVVVFGSRRATYAED